MAVTNEHLLVAMQDSDFFAMDDIVALPWDAPNRTEWKTPCLVFPDHLQVRIGFGLWNTRRFALGVDSLGGSRGFPHYRQRCQTPCSTTFH